MKPCCAKIFCIFVFIFISLANICSEDILQKINFTERDIVPSRFLFDETYYDKTHNVFLVTPLFSDSKLVEYNLDDKQIKNIIFETESGSFIKETEISNGFISFSVSSLSEAGMYFDIYYYDVYLKELHQINNNPLNKTTGEFRVSIKIHDNFIVWIEHDFTNKTSYIKYYDIKNKTITAIDSSAFINTRLRIPFTFVAIDGTNVVYSKTTGGDETEIIIYDIIQKLNILEIQSPQNVVIYYSASLNIEHKYIAFYAKTKDNGDILYIYKLENNSIIDVRKFDKGRIILNDVIRNKKDNIFFIEILNTTGWLDDAMYYGEIHNFETNSTEETEWCFDIFIGNKYTAYLKAAEYGLCFELDLK